MTLVEKVSHVKESEIFKLVFEGKVLGLRVRFFDVNIDKFLYYDFELDTIKGNQGVVQFINSINKDMRSISLSRNGSGLLVSEDEVKHGVIVQEFENESDAVTVLGLLSRIYKVRR